MSERMALAAMAEAVLAPFVSQISLSMLNDEDAHPTLRQFDVVLITDPQRGIPELGIILELDEPDSPLIGIYGDPDAVNIDPVHLEVLTHTTVARQIRDAHD